MISINNHDGGFQARRTGRMQGHSNCRIFQKEIGQLKDQAITCQC